MPTFGRYWKTAGSMIRGTYRDPDEVAGRLRSAIIDHGGASRARSGNSPVLL